MKKIGMLTLIALFITGGVYLLASSPKAETESVVTLETQEVSLSEDEVLEIETFAEANNIGYFEAVAIFKLSENTEYTKEELLLLERDILLDLALDVAKERLDLEGLRAELDEKKAAFEAEKASIETFMETYEIPLNQVLLIKALVANDDTLNEDELALLPLEELQTLAQGVVEEETQALKDELAPYLEEARSRLDELKERFESYKESREESITEETPSL